MHRGEQEVPVGLQIMNVLYLSWRAEARAGGREKERRHSFVLKTIAAPTDRLLLRPRQPSKSGLWPSRGSDSRLLSTSNEPHCRKLEQRALKINEENLLILEKRKRMPLSSEKTLISFCEKDLLWKMFCSLLCLPSCDFRFQERVSVQMFEAWRYQHQKV